MAGYINHDPPFATCSFDGVFVEHRQVRAVKRADADVGDTDRQMAGVIGRPPNANGLIQGRQAKTGHGL